MTPVTPVTDFSLYNSVSRVYNPVDRWVRHLRHRPRHGKLQSAAIPTPASTAPAITGPAFHVKQLEPLGGGTIWKVC